MTARYPLSGPQRSKLTIVLASVERDLQRLREIIASPPQNLLLTSFEERIPRHLAAALESAAADVERQLRAIARQLQLEPTREPLRRSLLASLLLAEANIHDIRPSGGLRGYGRVQPQTAQYLEPALNELQLSLRKLTKLLASAGE